MPTLVDKKKEEPGDEFKSRGYQDQILKTCIERNTIIYLPTGAGKTYIAIMALKHFANDLEKPISEGGKRSVFLTNTVALAHQQAEVISKTTPLKVAVYSGDMNVDAWNKEKWFNEFDENQVITATVQIVLDVIRHGYLSISNFNLIVFDECHNAQKEHPMKLLMNKFADIPESEHPRVIGLTGMLTTPSIKPQNVLDDLLKLEATFRATITTAKGADFNDVLMHSTCPAERVLEYEKNNFLVENQDYIARKVKDMVKMIGEWPLDNMIARNSDPRLEKQPKPSKKYETICNDFQYQIGNLGLYGGTLANMAAIVDMELKKREASTSTAKWLTRLLITAFEEILHVNMQKVYDFEEEFEKMEIDDEIDEQTVNDDPSTVLTNSTDQVVRLLLYLKQFAETHGEPMKGLIFVKRRYTARILCHVVRRYMNNYPELNVKVDFITGRNAYMPDSIETLMGCKNNNRMLDKFKRGEIDLIIATSVLEEGIDLQECNLVVCFDEIETFRQYVQTKGRARMKNSHFIIMSPSGQKNKLAKKTAEWIEINQTLRNYLVEKAVDRSPPLQDDIDKAAELQYNEIYTTEKGATVDFNSATALINRYCASLPQDVFTSPVLQWSSKMDEGKALPSLKLAKRSAAFEAIKALHKIGDLSDNLLPIRGQKCVDKYKDEYFRTWHQFENDDPKTSGTRKNYRMHDIVNPFALIDSMSRLNTPLYLYELEILPNFSAFDGNDENVTIFHRLLKSARTYAILTSKKLPHMGLMKFYQSFGQIECKVSYEPRVITLGDTEKLGELKRFHCLLFRNVLDIWKEFFVYDHKDSVIIVPIKNHQIDWNIIEKFQTWSDLKEKSPAERRNVVYREEDWLHSVVCPWYRADQNVRYVVTQVSKHQNPLSDFPNDEFKNYAAYALNKYPNIKDVVNLEQFLIGVKPLTSHLNRLHPGEGEDGRKNKVRSRGPELLIPELCHNFHFPGDLWMKAIILPSALHRIRYILHSENIRLDINNYIGLNVVDYMPNPLTEKMAKMKKGYAKPTIQNTIIHPKPDDCVTKELKASDIERFDADNAILCPELEEPIDLERQFDTAFEIDIDYYFQFINRFNDMSLQNKGDNNNLFSPTRFQNHKNVPALCDVEKDDRLHIRVLDIKLSTPVPRGIEQNDILSAITTSSSNDVFHMELFEVLGDAFLKFSVSLYLIQKHTDWHEGFLTTIKGQMVGNRNLCYGAIRHNLPGMMKVHHFNPKDDWQPPMFKVEDEIQEIMKEFNVKPDLLYKLSLSEVELETGEINQENLANFVQKFVDESATGGEDSTMQNFLGKQRIADKTCADCVEAILGASVVSVGIERTFKVLEMFDVLPRNEMDVTKILQNKLRSPRIRTNIRDKEIDGFLTNHKKLEASIGYTFKDRAYLLQALTHPSYPTNRVTGCYQQLEFLGDAVLDFLVTAYIFERCPQMDPGQLTDLRSALVNNVTLACLCVRYNIHTFILSQSAVLTESVNHFADFQLKNNHDVGDHVELLMEEGDVQCQMADYVGVPKTLGDVFEALIGGIFLDTGNDLEVTWKVIYRLMEKELHKFMADVPIQMVRRLYEYPNANPEFDAPVVSEELDRVMVDLRFTCNGERILIHGFGENKDAAKRAAAKLALTKLLRS